MGFMDIFWWPFGLTFAGAVAIMALLVIIFWIWMIIDAAKRKFRNDVEKILWVLIILFASWIGSLVYFIVVKIYNPKGLTKKR